MIKNRKLIFWLFLIISMVSGQSVLAGTYGMALSNCIIQATSPEDRNDFVMWMFSAMAQHPSVREQTSISQEIAEESTIKTAKVFERLLTEDCKDETANVIKYEGTAELEKSFNLLGQVAAKELFQNEDVAQSLSALEKHIDVQKLEDALQQ